MSLKNFSTMAPLYKDLDDLMENMEEVKNGYPQTLNVAQAIYVICQEVVEIKEILKNQEICTSSAE